MTLPANSELLSVLRTSGLLLNQFFQVEERKQTPGVPDTTGVNVDAAHCSPSANC